jgi:hypothetical protein
VFLVAAAGHPRRKRGGGRRTGPPLPRCLLPAIYILLLFVVVFFVPIEHALHAHKPWMTLRMCVFVIFGHIIVDPTRRSFSLIYLSNGVRTGSGRNTGLLAGGGVRVFWGLRVEEVVWGGVGGRMDLL